MFVVLQIMPQQSGVFARIREHFNQPEPEIEKIAVKNGAPFFVLRVRRKKDSVPWEEVMYAAGRCAQRLLMTSDDIPPDNLPIHAFVPQLLPFRMLFNTALRLLAGDERTKTQIGIIDSDAALAGVLGRALEVSAVVRVVTDRQREYERAAQQIFDECGAPVMVGDDVSLLSGCNVLVCRSSCDAARFHGRVFALDSVMKDETMRQITLPPEYESIRPKGVQKLTFACALYELCGAKTLGELSFDW